MWRGGAGYVMAMRVAVGSEARFDWARRCGVRPGRASYGKARSEAGLGGAVHGAAGRGSARHGEVRQGSF